MKIFAFGSVKDGKLFIKFRRQFDFQLSKIKGDVEITISKGKRTDKQNRLYWSAILPPISEHTGYSTAELDRIFEQKYSPRETKVWRGQQIITIKHCRELDKNEFSEFLERILVDAGELGIKINLKDELFT